MDISLPIYPSEIRGAVRHILLLKDFFLLCSRLVERYCRFGTIAGRQLSREFILSEISTGIDTIEMLKGELINQQRINSEFEKKLFAIRKELSKRSDMFDKSDTLVFESVCYRLKNGKNRTKLGADRCIDIYYNKSEVELILPDPFECQKLKTILEFLQELYLIQLHFHIILIQGLNFSLPLLINGLHFLDRLINWPKRPEFGMIHKKINLNDKLRDIQVDLQRLVEELVSSCLIVEAKFHYDQKLEFYYQKTIENQCMEKSLILEKIQFEKEMYDLIKLEHSRIVGYIIKKDPGFANNSIITDYPISSHLKKDFEGKKGRRQSTSVSTYSSDPITSTLQKTSSLVYKPKERSGKSIESVSRESQRSRNKHVSKVFEKLPKGLSTNNAKPLISTDDKTNEDLLKLSSTFNFHSVDSDTDFIEPKSTKFLEKMYGIVDDIVYRDWNEISHLKKNI